MSEKIETREMPEGNTKPRAKQGIQLINWFFTYNNYELSEIEILKSYFDSVCKSYCFQQEKGENGTKHLQGVITLYKKMRWTEFGLSKNIHWEKLKGKVEDAYKYCCKSESREGLTYTKNYKVPKPLKIIEKLFNWQQSIVNDILMKEPNGRTVHWIFDSKGESGKTQLSKYAVVKQSAFGIQGGKLEDIMNMIFNLNMDNIDNIIIDIPRETEPKKISYSAMECILNGMITNTKYETGVKLFNPPNLIVFANIPPNFQKMSMDRWKIYLIKDKNLILSSPDEIMECF